MARVSKHFARVCIKQQIKKDRLTVLGTVLNMVNLIQHSVTVILLLYSLGRPK